jgi:hypothetical protein
VLYPLSYGGSGTKTLAAGAFRLPGRWCRTRTWLPTRTHTVVAQGTGRIERPGPSVVDAEPHGMP